jgi:hypothetical protein
MSRRKLTASILAEEQSTSQSLRASGVFDAVRQVFSQMCGYREISNGAGSSIPCWVASGMANGIVILINVPVVFVLSR